MRRVGSLIIIVCLGMPALAQHKVCDDPTGELATQLHERQADQATAFYAPVFRDRGNIYFPDGYTGTSDTEAREKLAMYPWRRGSFIGVRRFGRGFAFVELKGKERSVYVISGPALRAAKRAHTAEVY